jgi:hypothetical protein
MPLDPREPQFGSLAKKAVAFFGSSAELMGRNTVYW